MINFQIDENEERKCSQKGEPVSHLQMPYEYLGLLLSLFISAVGGSINVQKSVGEFVAWRFLFDVSVDPGAVEKERRRNASSIVSWRAF